jgi:type IV pilus assembly protein PilB
MGEKVPIRILDPEKGVKALTDSGLEGRNLEAIKEGLNRPYGLILLTGPTGSGKTTTLYAMLQTINEERYNIVSLEDPIEYNIEGLNQSQVRPEIDYDFASGLRSILRQDPDIIMVGEIRDKETAQLAIHAALTGHLVLSTLHTNSAVGVVPRLIDMGVDPFLIAPTLALAIGQRLVRTLCPESRRELKVEGSVKERLEKELAELPESVRRKIKMPREIYQALPSGTCPQGTRGRTAVFEVLSMTPELEALILKRPTESEILKEARRQGMITMREDGILKVLEGKVGFEELSEVV